MSFDSALKDIQEAAFIRANPQKVLSVVNSHVPMLALCGFCVPGDLNDDK
jgi:hypothetical protein